MSEILVITLMVIFCIVILAGCIAAILSAIMLLQISSFLLTLAKAIDDLRNAIKESFDVQAEGQKAVAESNVKISNHNSQVLMDTLVTLIQMQELVLKGLGYAPQVEKDSGLKDLEEAAPGNYNKPPAPTQQEGLSFPKV